jgi:integrase
LAHTVTRHAAAGLMIQQGAHPRTMMGRLGHASISVTMNTYGHLIPAVDEGLSQAMTAYRV